MRNASAIGLVDIAREVVTTVTVVLAAPANSSNAKDRAMYVSWSAPAVRNVGKQRVTFAMPTAPVHLQAFSEGMQTRARELRQAFHVYDRPDVLNADAVALGG